MHVFARILLLLGAMAVVGASLAVGALLLVFLLGAGAILALVLWVRFRLLRGFRWPGAGGRRSGPARDDPHTSGRQTTIEGEYRVRRSRPGRGRHHDDP
ncbi:hypothetical protein QWY84_13630 [Aquisalimonas lutea]|uniref:hypothetical protein n=1 Tax=Aquisalimonas lutea TaxID=1327750 RepID=UPI0025B600A0|nr:hypothetical protein [Aquisalimonas lutea]MDN3518656.1 hypothetical protein [Aquisalimonas lutea]